jgi:hypothetical protein
MEQEWVKLPNPDLKMHLKLFLDQRRERVPQSSVHVIRI